MDKDALEQFLQALASSEVTSNDALVEAYLKDPQARPVEQLIERATSRHRGSRLLLPPSHCLTLLD